MKPAGLRRDFKRPEKIKNPRPLTKAIRAIGRERTLDTFEILDCAATKGDIAW